MARLRQTTTTEATSLWTRRANALAAGSILLTEKPDRSQWTRDDRRVYYYALAISRRIEKLQ